MNGIERRNLRYGKVVPSKTGNASGVFPYFSPSVSASKTKETETDDEAGDNHLATPVGTPNQNSFQLWLERLEVVFSKIPFIVLRCTV